MKQISRELISMTPHQFLNSSARNKKSVNGFRFLELPVKMKAFILVKTSLSHMMRLFWIKGNQELLEVSQETEDYDRQCMGCGSFIGGGRICRECSGV